MRRLLAVLLLLLWPLTLAAQDATLVSDRVIIPPGGDQLIAEGNVEVFFEGTRLSAARITYDRSADRLIIDGPIFIVTEDGQILTATAADLDPRLENGLLRGARLILEEQLQLAANRIDRVEGRYTQLTQVAVTSCHICETGQAPLWEIRASRVVHDTEERQLYFDNATFRVAGLPIFWLPRMRLPDPTLTRATGFLVPGFRSNDRLGFGITLPYFIRLGDRRDLTLTPYLSDQTATLEARFRQAYLRGQVEVEGAVSNDTLRDGTRAYMFARGAFQLNNDVKLRFDLETVSDDDYLFDYGYSSKDRLDSRISFEQVRDRTLAQGRLTFYDTLRDDEDDPTLPPFVIDASYVQRRAFAGGTLSYGAELEGHVRTAPAGVDGLGDALRAGLFANWTGSTVHRTGLVIEGAAALRLDAYAFSADATADDTGRAALNLATTLRYPLIRQTQSATHMLEPVLQLAWSGNSVGNSTGAIPNEDSTSSEFDETNLFALSRFAGEDRVETGARAALGLTWTREGASGWGSSLTVGRIFRSSSLPDFTMSSGLDGTTSDWLLAGQLRAPDGFMIESRALFDDDLAPTRSETRARWSSDRVDLAAGYIFLPADAAEERPDDVFEWTIDSAYRINDIWTVGFDTRYDLVSDRATDLGVSVGWQNECVTIDFSVSRSYASSTSVDPTTDYDLTVGINGFSAGRSGNRPAARCQAN